jgi:hypothetical protein
MFGIFLYRIPKFGKLFSLQEKKLGNLTSFAVGATFALEIASDRGYSPFSDKRIRWFEAESKRSTTNFSLPFLLRHRWNDTLLRKT